MFCFNTGEDELAFPGGQRADGGALRQHAEDDVRVPLFLGNLPAGLLRLRHGDVHDLLGEIPFFFFGRKKEHPLYSSRIIDLSQNNALHSAMFVVPLYVSTGVRRWWCYVSYFQSVLCVCVFCMFAHA